MGGTHFICHTVKAFSVKKHRNEWFQWTLDKIPIREKAFTKQLHLRSWWTYCYEKAINTFGSNSNNPMPTSIQTPKTHLDNFFYIMVKLILNAFNIFLTSNSS